MRLDSLGVGAYLFESSQQVTTGSRGAGRIRCPL